ncbi:MAG: glucose 1-dehydrogenase [Ilumatobacteraceae bacterium]
MGRLDGKVALITGGARGQGATAARLFVSEGAKVLVTDVLADAGQQLADELGDSAAFVRHDVSDENDWTNAVDLAVRRFGKLDVLVNNAGIWLAKPLVEHTVDEFQSIVGVNQLGTFLGIRTAVAPMTANGGGSIVNISSGAGLRGSPNCIAYTASKYAITGMTTGSARALARFRIRVNSIHPGVTDTAMLDGVPNVDEMLGGIPMRRKAQPAEIANVALFLASDESSYMTGAQVAVDGGFAA